MNVNDTKFIMIVSGIFIIMSNKHIVKIIRFHTTVCIQSVAITCEHLEQQMNT